MKYIVNFLSINTINENFNKSNIITLKLEYFNLINGYYSDFKVV